MNGRRRRDVFVFYTPIFIHNLLILVSRSSPFSQLPHSAMGWAGLFGKAHESPSPRTTAVSSIALTSHSGITRGLPRSMQHYSSCRPHKYQLRGLCRKEFLEMSDSILDPSIIGADNSLAFVDLSGLLCRFCSTERLDPSLTHVTWLLSQVTK